jgi:predicted negative regulator of RcsB-dependent stress response
LPKEFKLVDAQFTEDEQVERLKNWWKSNGSSVVIGVAIGLAAVAGYNWWQSSKQATAESASGLYEEMLIRHSESDVSTAEQMGGTLMDDFAATPYAAMAALFMARISVEKDDIDSAAAQLRWVLDNAKDEALHPVARLRLADIMIARKEYAEAEALLKANLATDAAGFDSHTHELLGDVYAASGRGDEARAAYEKSLELLSAGSGYRDVLALKRDNIDMHGNGAVGSSDN